MDPDSIMLMTLASVMVASIGGSIFVSHGMQVGMESLIDASYFWVSVGAAGCHASIYH